MWKRYIFEQDKMKRIKYKHQTRDGRQSHKAPTMEHEKESPAKNNRLEK
jgi:hypothetical protein